MTAHEQFIKRIKDGDLVGYDSAYGDTCWLTREFIEHARPGEVEAYIHARDENRRKKWQRGEI